LSTGELCAVLPGRPRLTSRQYEVLVAVGGKEWTRTIQITGGEIHLDAKLEEK
jgi:hypothetical protein